MRIGAVLIALAYRVWPGGSQDPAEAVRAEGNCVLDMVGVLCDPLSAVLYQRLGGDGLLHGLADLTMGIGLSRPHG